MATNFKNIFVGLRFKPVTTLTSDSLGEVQSSSVDNKTYLHNGTTRSPLLTESHSAQLTNKSISADTNPISDLEVDNLKAGVLNTSTVLAGASDLQVPSALAVKTYVDDTFATQTDVEDLVTLSGVLVNSVDLGTFTGTTIPDDQTIKEALQALETGLEAHISDTVDAHDASAISFVPVGAVTATDVQAAIAEIDADLTAHIQDATDAHDASAISNIPAGNLVATDVQSALNELQSDIDTRALDSALQAHINDTVDAHDASAISVVPFASISSTDVQSALEELQAEIAAGGAGDVVGPVSSTDNAIARFDGITGKLIQNSVVTVSDTGVIAGASIDADTNTITNIENADIKVGANIDQAKIANLVSDLAAKVDEVGGSIITPARLDMKQDTLANLTTYALTATNGQLVFATDTKETFVVKDGALSAVGGGSGELLPDTLLQQSFESATLAQFTQTGLNLLEAPLNILIKGKKTAQLVHQSAINQSFKQIIPVDNEFKGKVMNFSLDIRSTASQGNVTVLFRDETNSVNLGSSQQITTGSQAISVTTTSGLATLGAISNDLFNSLSVGMSVTGSGIPAATTILSLNSATRVVTLSQNATASATVTARFSALPAKAQFGFTLPKNCSSVSYLITALPEVGAETYVDNIYIELTSAALSSTSVTVPKITNEDVRYAGANLLSTTGNIRFSTSGIALIPSTLISYNSATGFFTAVKDVYVSGGFTLDIASAAATFDLNVNGVFRQRSNTTPASANYKSTVGFAIKLAAGEYFNISTAASLTNSAQDSFTFVATANETETKTIPLTNSVLVTEPDSMVEVSVANGYGLTNTVIRRFLNVDKSIGKDILYQDSPTLGGSFTVLTEGVYNITYLDNLNGLSNIGISLNSTQLTTDINSIPIANKLAQSVIGAAGYKATACVSGVYLNAGDVIRAHTSGTAATANNDVQLIMTKVGSTKIVNPSSDQKIDIPTHSLRFEGASTRGSTDTAIVKFDTLANIRGDGFEVVNTVANGTVVTIKKAGRLSVSASLRFAIASPATQITKNQTTLTANSTSLSEVFAVEQTGGADDTLSISGFCDVVVGDKIRISANNNPTTTSGLPNSLTLSLQENSVAVALSNVLPQFTEGDSAVRLDTGNGFGSSLSLVRRFANVPDNFGSAVTYIDSATLGASLTIQEEGLFDISYSEDGPAGSSVLITKNQTTSISSANVLAAGYVTANSPFNNAATQAYLLKGDVIRAVVGTPGNIASTSTTTKFSISKVGKPNITSVDVTPFVNIKTDDTQAIEALTPTSTFGSTNTGVPVLNITKNTNNGVIRVDSSAANGTSFVALKACKITITTTATDSVSARSFYITRNSTVLTAAVSNGTIAEASMSAGQYTTNLAGTADLQVGDVIRINRDAVASQSILKVTILATAASDTIATPTQQISSDTIPFTFKATAIVDADPIGTFNTYTYAANTNTATISGSAPTQTVASMNTNGVQVFSRAYTAASTASSPTRVVIKIGKGLKSTDLAGYFSASKVGAFAFGRGSNAVNTEFGTDYFYDESTGLLTIDAGYGSNSSFSTRFVSINPASGTSGYFTFNASTSPSITALPILQPRIAYLSDVKASGTAGGGTTGATTQTRVLNTLVDTTGIVTSLASNQFALSAGTYSIEASAPGYATSQHKLRLRNITDSTTSLVGTAEQSTTSVQTRSFVSGEITITSSKTFELQQYFQSTKPTDGMGLQTNMGESEVYAQVKITKVR